MKVAKGENPWGYVTQVGGAFAESRSLERTYGGNPYAQSRLLDVLVNLHRTATEHYNTVRGENMNDDEVVLAAGAIATTIKYFDKLFPTWRNVSFEPDSEFDLPTYHVNSDLIRWVDDIVQTLPEES